MTTKRVEKVIFIDDSEDEVFLARMLFEQQAIDLDIIHVATPTRLEEACGSDAIGTGKAMIVVDLNMPEAHGTDVVRRLRQDERYRDNVVGVCTGSDDPADRKGALEAGAEFFVNKPLEKNALSRICDQVERLTLQDAKEGGCKLQMKL